MNALEQAAHFLCDRVGLLMGMPDDFIWLRRAAGAITNESRFSGVPLPDAANRILEAALEQQDRGECINRFWFEDRRWRCPRLSKAEQREIDNRRARDEAMRRLYVRMEQEQQTQSEGAA
jgi:hypothetical protein